MLRFQLSVLLFLLLISGLNAQTIYERSDTAAFVFSYKPYERSSNNNVLNQLALAHLKLPEKTSVIYSFRYRVSVNYRQNDSLFVLLDVKTLDVKGDKQIKDFNITKLLEPSGYNISFSIIDPMKGVIIHDKKDVIMDEGLVQISAFPDSLWKAGMDVSLMINDISFTASDFRQLELELTAIRDYYSSASLGDTLLSKIQKARKNPGELYDIIRIYTTGVKGLYLLNQSLDVSSEIVPGTDPLKVAHKNAIIKYNLEEFVNYVSQSNTLLLKGDVYETFATAYLQSLRDANKLSQQVDYYSSPFYYRLYSNSITADQIMTAGKLFGSEMERRGIKNIDFRKLTKALMQEYLNESKTLIADNRYMEAVDLLTGAVKFKDIVPDDQNSKVIEQALVMARKGLINSYIGIMQKALNKNLLTLAEKYLSEVEKHIARYEMTKEETGPFKEIYLRMADTYVQLGNSALNKNDFDAALNDFTKALELTDGIESSISGRAVNGQQIAVRSQYNQIIKWIYILVDNGNHEEAAIELSKAERLAEKYDNFYPDKWEVYVLTYKIAELRYNSILKELKSLFGQTVTEQRIAELVEANELYKRHQFPDYSTLDTLLTDLGVRYLSGLFSHGRLKHWASEPDSALFIANNAYTMAVRLSLNNNPAIKKQYDELVKLAGETFCSEALGQFNSLVSQASELFKANKFTMAKQKVNQAREIVYQKASCGLTTMPINKLLNQYQYQIKWDEMVADAFRLLKERNYQASANLIQQAESIYSYYKLDTAGLANIGYFDLAIKSDDREMLRHAISHYVSRGKPDQSIALLEKLRLTGCPAEETFDLQENLARNIALRDKAETFNLNVKVMLESYTAGNKWYARFENVYKYYTKQTD